MNFIVGIRLGFFSDVVLLLNYVKGCKNSFTMAEMGLKEEEQYFYYLLNGNRCESKKT